MQAPRDSKNQILAPFDFVKVGEIPDHYWSDPNFSVLKSYGHSIGMISYYQDEYWYYGNPEHPGWVNANADVVNVRCVRVDAEQVSTYSFWLPCTSVTKLPHNVLFMALFERIQFQIEIPGEGVADVIRPDSLHFKWLSAIASTPVDKLYEVNELILNELRANFPPGGVSQT
jgi:hypothetical protein